MRALTIDYEQRELRERDVPEPRIAEPGEVRFRILETGICGTDRELAAFRFGHGPEGDNFLIPGHEALGEVLESSVAHLNPGDLVVPSVRRECVPPCPSCLRHRRDLCLTGRYTERGIFGAHGYFTEVAVDRAEDLLPVPAALRHTAVLLEPLSVVEKAISRALELHQGAPAKALVLGGGTIGLLAAMTLRLRGLDVDVVSTEPSGSERAQLIEAAGVRYLNEPDRRADIAIEAAGAPEAADKGLKALGPLGVLMILGAKQTVAPPDLLDLIVGNRVVAGSVNASPEAWSQAVQDLAEMPASILSSMIERVAFSEYPVTLRHSAGQAPKTVHVIAGTLSL